MAKEETKKPICVICQVAEATELTKVCKPCDARERRRAAIQTELDQDLTGQDQEIFNGEE